MILAERLDLDIFSCARHYKLPDGRFLSIDRYALQHYGEAECLRAHGVTLSHERAPVMQDGETIGTLPVSFDWASPGVGNPLVDIRPGDFTFRDGAWIASRTLGSGDLEAIPSFRRDFRED